MASLTEYTYLLNEDSTEFSDNQLKTLVKLLPTAIPEGMTVGSPELYAHLQAQALKECEGDSVYGIAVHKLIDAYDPVTQRDIVVGKVFNVLAGDFGLLKGYGILEPLLIGKDPDGKLVNEGGRHRTAAVVSMFKAFGYSDEQILEVTIPCFVLRHNVFRILSNNGSRGVTSTEKSSVQVSKLGVNTSDMTDIWQSYVQGKLEGSSLKQRSDAMRLFFVAATEDKRDILTEDTRGKIATALPGAFKRMYPKLDYALKNPNFLVDMMAYVVDNLDEVLLKQRQAGVTNYARSTAQIANGAIMMLGQHIKDNKNFLPEKPAAKPPAAKVTEKAKAETTTTAKKTTKKTKKAAPEAVEAPVVDAVPVA